MQLKIDFTYFDYKNERLIKEERDRILNIINQNTNKKICESIQNQIIDSVIFYLENTNNKIDLIIKKLIEKIKYSNQFYSYYFIDGLKNNYYINELVNNISKWDEESKDILTKISNLDYKLILNYDDLIEFIKDNLEKNENYKIEDSIEKYYKYLLSDNRKIKLFSTEKVFNQRFYKYINLNYTTYYYKIEPKFLQDSNMHTSDFNQVSNMKEFENYNIENFYDFSNFFENTEDSISKKIEA